MRFKKKKTWKVRLEPKNEGFSFLLHFYAGILREFQISSITLSIVIVYQFYRQMSTRIRLHKLRRHHHRRSGTPPSFSGSYKVEPDASNFINNLSIVIKNFKINRLFGIKKENLRLLKFSEQIGTCRANSWNLKDGAIGAKGCRFEPRKLDEYKSCSTSSFLNQLIRWQI